MKDRCQQAYNKYRNKEFMDALDILIVHNETHTPVKVLTDGEKTECEIIHDVAKMFDNKGLRSNQTCKVVNDFLKNINKSLNEIGNNLSNIPFNYHEKQCIGEAMKNIWYSHDMLQQIFKVEESTE